jgi:protein TonB
MISRHSSISIATALGLHVLLVMLVISGMFEHVHKEIEIPPVIIELLQPKKLEPPPPPPKPEPKKPEPPKPPKPEPVKPEPPKVVEQRPEPPKPEPAKPASPAPEPPPKPAPAPAPAPEPVVKPAPPPAPAPAPTPAKSSSGSSAQYVGSCEAPYPTMSKRMNEKGTVVVKVLVKSDGTAGDVELKSSSGYPRLDQAWLEAIKNCRFNPSTGNDGKPIDEWFSAPHTFRLN